MDFDLTEEQRLLQDSVDRLLADRYDFEQRKALRQGAGGLEPRARGRNMPSSACSACPSPRSMAASAAAPVETMIVMEAFGRALALEPYFATVVLGGGLLRHGGSEAQRAELRAADRRGRAAPRLRARRAAVALRPADVATTAQRDGDGWVLDGEQELVLHGDSADKLLVTARIAGGRATATASALFLVDATAPGVSRRGYRTQDGQRAAEIDARRTCASSRRRCIGDPEDALPLVERVVDEAIAALCAEAVGAMDEMHALTVEYLKTRKQFGVADRHVPGAAAPRRRHAGGARAGAQHGDVRRP